MIFFHGGGGVAGSADIYANMCCRYAVESDVTVVNVDYRLAPEHKSPAAIMDAYAALKYVVKNADKLSIDKYRIGTFGESGGGWVTTGLGMLLAERDESYLVKF
jgi:acetyl esterase